MHCSRAWNGTGSPGPSKVMWAKDDEVRSLLEQLGQSLNLNSATIPEWKAELLKAASAALNAVGEMIYKEENILFPMSLETLSEDEWAEIWSASPKYGWCIVEPRQGYVPALSVRAESINVPHTGALMLPTAHVSMVQMA